MSRIRMIDLGSWTMLCLMFCMTWVEVPCMEWYMRCMINMQLLGIFDVHVGMRMFIFKSLYKAMHRYADGWYGCVFESSCLARKPFMNDACDACGNANGQLGFCRVLFLIANDLELWRWNSRWELVKKIKLSDENWTSRISYHTRNYEKD